MIHQDGLPLEDPSDISYKSAFRLLQSGDVRARFGVSDTSLATVMEVSANELQKLRGAVFHPLHLMPYYL